jgi:hypothetical protein
MEGSKSKIARVIIRRRKDRKEHTKIDTEKVTKGLEAEPEVMQLKAR